MIRRALCWMMVVAFMGVSSARAERLEMAFIDTDAAPFKWKQNGKYVGPVIDIMTEAARRCGVAVSLIPLPAKRIDDALANGIIDGAFGVSRKPSRENLAVFIDPPIGILDAHLFVTRENEFSFTTIGDLFGKKIGLVRGLVFGEVFDAEVARGKISIDNSPNYSSLLKMLILGRVDAVAAPAPVFDFHIAKMGLTEKVVMLPNPLRPDFGLHVALSKASAIYALPNLKGKMEKALRDMAAGGEFDRIYGGYGFRYRSVP